MIGYCQGGEWIIPGDKLHLLGVSTEMIAALKAHGVTEPRKCKHCGVKIEQHAPGSDFWTHIVGPGSRLNSCQHPDVPYGHEAHPEGTDCPNWCLGSRL